MSHRDRHCRSERLSGIEDDVDTFLLIKLRSGYTLEILQVHFVSLSQVRIRVWWSKRIPNPVFDSLMTCNHVYRLSIMGAFCVRDDEPFDVQKKRERKHSSRIAPWHHHRWLFFLPLLPNHLIQSDTLLLYLIIIRIIILFSCRLSFPLRWWMLRRTVILSTEQHLTQIIMHFAEYPDRGLISGRRLFLAFFLWLPFSLQIQNFFCMDFFQ